MPSTRVSLVLLLACSTFILSHANYVATPDRNTRITVILKRSVDLRCDYRGPDGDGQFTEWYKDDIPISREKPGHYVVKTSHHQTNLTIKIFVHNDSLVRTWSVRTNKPGTVACRFDRIHLVPSPQSMSTNRDTERLDASKESVRRTEGEPISFKCNIKPEEDRSKGRSRIEWYFSTEDDNSTFTKLPADIKRPRPDEIRIDAVKKSHRGYYRCTLNNVFFQVQLRVKDRLAALWPFLGIVTVVVLLVLLILLCEKRQKGSRRTVINDDENHDHTKDPLVRATNNPSDNDNKKRAIKA